MQSAIQYYHQAESKHFLHMLVAGAALHVVVLTALWLWPRKEVLEIPVRTLNITLGSVDLSTAAKAKTEFKAPVTPAAEKKEAPPAPKPATKNEASFKPAAKPKKIPVKPKPVVKKEPVRRAPALQPSAKTIPTGVTKKIKLPYVQNPAPLPAPPAPKVQTEPSQAIPVIPQASQYVRQSAAPIAPMAMSDTMSAKTEREIRARYTQQISSWLEQHRVIPKATEAVRGVIVPELRVRIDRSGVVKYFAINRSSGYPQIDQAAMDMVRRANPMPVPPATFPGGQLLEFTIPVTFDLR